MRSQLPVPKYVLDDLSKFIENYHGILPNSTLIAQAFCMRFNEYGMEFGVYAISDTVEYVLTQQSQ
jgi:hypothetical protein